MKQLLLFAPQFNPTAKTLDFTSYPSFAPDKLYGVINITRNVPLFAPGAPGYGGTFNGSILTLQYDTSSHSTSDIINVYYDTALGWETNSSLENNGNLQQVSENMQLILQELRLMNWILSDGLNIKREDVVAMRNDLQNPSNEPNN